MLRTLGIVELPPRAVPRLQAGRRLGGKSLLEWAVRRVTESTRLSGVIVLAPRIDEAADLALLVPPDVPLYRSERPDELGRLADALGAFPAESVVRVSIHHPFIDPVLIDGLVTRADGLPQADYLGYCSRDGRPAVLSPLGLFGEWFHGKAIVRADREATSPADRELVTSYFISRPEKFSLRLIPVPESLQRDDLRLALDTEEDWDNAQAIIDALGTERLDWQQIAGLVDNHPALRERMAELNRAAALA